MIFLSILEFLATRYIRCRRSAMSSTTVETTSAGAASETRPPAGGKASDIAAVIKATERPTARSWLKVRSRRSVEARTSAAWPASVERVAMVEVAVIEVVVAEIVPIDDRPAVGDVGVVVVDHPMAMPVAPPVVPAPSVSSEETDAEPDSETNPHSSHEDPRLGIPAWIRDNRPTVHEPGIVGRHVDHFRVDRFDDEGVPLGRYFLLVIAIEVAGIVSLLTHGLDGVCHILL